MDQLREAIKERSARIAVIGLGYVGLPVAALFADAGFDVLGVELRADRVASIQAGECPIKGNEPGLAELVARVVGAGKLCATTNYQDLADRDIVLLDVETPVDEDNRPQYEALRSALRELAPVMKKGALVIVESTTAPGTLMELVLPLLEGEGARALNRDFYLGNCPERVMPGKLLKNLRTVNRVVGGTSPTVSDLMVGLYRCIVQADLDPADCTTAELVKTAENAYRDVQIAFANEVALLCDAVGSDVWKVRELVNKSPFRQMHLPGAGVGGHCIPKDPWLLISPARNTDLPVRLIPAARAVNGYMPHYMVELTRQALAASGRRLEQSRLVVMGYAYLENSDDVRNSPSRALVDELAACGSDVAIHDPHVPGYEGDLREAARDADVLVVMVAHADYVAADLASLGAVMRTRLLVDGRAVYTEQQAKAAGFAYVGLGKGARTGGTAHV